MTRGKKTCKILKEIRQQIADRNDIEYITSECHFQGECQGTCPKCEAELQYLENELSKRRQLGKVVAVAGISLGIAGSFAACNSSVKQENIPTVEQEIVAEMPEIEIIPDKAKSTNEIFTIVCGEIDANGNIPPEILDEIVPIEEDVEDTRNFPDFP
jgi:hypothetical protein